MNLDDIKKVRNQFAELGTKRRESITTLPEISKTGDVQYAKWKRRKEIDDINMEYRKQQRELCERFFGSELSCYDYEVSPEDVLDWIEHFLKSEVACPKT